MRSTEVGFSYPRATVRIPISDVENPLMDANDTICYCFHVSKRKILKFIRLEKPRRASQISECAGAGTGCGWCIPFLQKYFEQSAEADAMTAEEYARARGDYIRAGKGKPPAGAIPPPDDQSAECSPKND